MNQASLAVQAPSLALCMIVKDETKEVVNLLSEYWMYFDKIYLTVTGLTEGEWRRILRHELTVGYDRIELTYFKWTDNFSEAREFNRKQVTEDYWFWMDADDRLEGAINLRSLTEYMSQNDLDIIQLKYEYAHNNLGESIADHWRERIIKTSHPLKWVGACHETLITPSANFIKSNLVKVIHNKSPEQMLASLERNRRILEADWEKNKDLRTAHYLGLTYMNSKEFDKAVEMFLNHIQSSGWDEERYRSWCKIAECKLLQGQLNKALSATNGAIDEKPDYPDAYFLKAMIYNDLNQFGKVVEWIKVALSKPEPETLSIVDPTLYKYRGLLMGALAFLQLGKVREAYAMYQEVKEKTPISEDLKNLFEESYYDFQAIQKVKWLTYYLLEKDPPKASKLFDSLPYSLYSDPRLNSERVKVHPPKKWGKSVVIFCGQSGEAWGPDTLDKGMGGSEEAIVYLSRELSNLGHQVTVFNDREDEYFDELSSIYTPKASVTFLPWTLLNPSDEFDTFIAWRVPEIARGVKAKKIFVDLHDTIEPQRVYAVADKVSKFFVKSDYHRSLYPDLPDEKFVIVGNGILKEHFE